MLGIPAGVLVVDNEAAMLLNIPDKIAYQTEQSSLMMEKFIKNKISAFDIIAAFSEKFPLSRSWDCKQEGLQQNCKTTSGLVLNYTPSMEQSRELILDSKEGKVTMIYQLASSGSTQFKVEPPSDYKKIKLD